MRSPKLVLLVALAVLVSMPGCALIDSLVDYPTPTPRPQRALRPTFTPTTPPTEAAPAAAEKAPAAETPAPPAEQTAAQPSASPEPPTPEPPTAEPPPPTATPVPIVIVPGQPVQARTGPGVTYDQAVELPSGSQLAIVGKNDAGDWWQVCCVNEQPVWVLSELVDEQGALDAIAVAANIPPPPTPTPTAVPKPAIVVTSPRVNARSGPNTEAAVLEQLLEGTRLEVVGRTPAGDWWQVCCVAGQPAWVSAELVASEGPVEAVAVVALPTPTPQATPTAAAVAAGIPTPSPTAQAGAYPFAIAEQTAFPFDGDYLRVGVKVRDAGGQALAGYALRVVDETTGAQWLSRQSTAGAWQYTAPSPAFDDFREANVLFDTNGKAPLAGTTFRLWLVDGRGRQVSPPVRLTGNTDDPQWLYVALTRQ